VNGTFVVENEFELDVHHHGFKWYLLRFSTESIASNIEIDG
jgi:hypothetical protein